MSKNPLDAVDRVVRNSGSEKPAPHPLLEDAVRHSDEIAAARSKADGKETPPGVWGQITRHQATELNAAAEAAGQRAGGVSTRYGVVASPSSSRRDGYRQAVVLFPISKSINGRKLRAWAVARGHSYFNDTDNRRHVVGVHPFSPEEVLAEGRAAGGKGSSVSRAAFEKSSEANRLENQYTAKRNSHHRETRDYTSKAPLPLRQKAAQHHYAAATHHAVAADYAADSGDQATEAVHRYWSAEHRRSGDRLSE